MKKKTKPKVEEKSMDFLDEYIINTTDKGVISKPQSYTVKVTHPSLRMRKAPNTQGEIVGIITDEGEYKIIDEVNGWGKLENGNWIMLSYTKIV